MTGRIYLLQGDSNLTPMVQRPYDSEKILQEMLAKYPDLLAGEQVNSDQPRKWVLVTREMAVQGEEEGAPRWSLDHLFLDQDGVPTLVEVKKGTNSEIRRKVVGQMLDYAANAVAYWPVEEVRAKFESRCEKDNQVPDETLIKNLGEDIVVDEFWQRVKTNLQAGRIRMVFVSDTIPTELRRIVEFLNEQMDPAEVLAVEVKQYVSDETNADVSTEMKTLVPRVLGQTETARQKKSPGLKSSKQWDEVGFMAELEKTSGTAERDVAKLLLDWIQSKGTYLTWGSGPKDGGIIPTIRRGNTKYRVCRLSTMGYYVFRFDWLRPYPPFNDEAVRKELLSRINQIPSVHFNDDVITTRARIPFQSLTNPAALEQLKATVQWLINQVPAGNETDSDEYLP